jgi:hypothetical protein
MCLWLRSIWFLRLSRGLVCLGLPTLVVAQDVGEFERQERSIDRLLTFADREHLPLLLELLNHQDASVRVRA